MILRTCSILALIITATAFAQEKPIVLRGHKNPIQAVAFSPDGKHVATADGAFWKPMIRPQLELWNAAGETERVIDSPEGKHMIGVQAAEFSPDGKRLAGFRFGQAAASVWDSANGKELAVLRELTGAVAAIAFSPDGRRIVTGGGMPAFDPEKGPGPPLDKPPPGEVKVWDAETGKLLHDLKGHAAAVVRVAFGPDGKRIASLGYDQVVRLWDAENGKELIKFNTVQRLDAAPMAFDGKRVAVAGTAKTEAVVNLVDAESGKETRSIKIAGQLLVTSLAFSGGRLLIATHDGVIRAFDPETAKELLKIETKHQNGMGPLAISPGGKRLATSGYDGTAKLWDAESGKELGTIKGVMAAHAVHPDGKTVAGLRGLPVKPDFPPVAVKVWNAATGALVRTLVVKGNGIAVVAYSGDGKRLAAVVSTLDMKDAQQDPFVGELRVWDVESGNEVRAVTGIRGWLMDLAVSDDGKRAATGSGDGFVRVWDVDTGKQLREFPGGWIVSLSRDGKRLAISDVFTPGIMEEGQKAPSGVRIVDVETGKELHGFKASAAVGGVAFGGERFAAGTGEGIRVWDANTGKEQFKSEAMASKVGFSADGKELITVSLQLGVTWRDAATGKVLRRLKPVVALQQTPYDRRGFPVALSADGKLVAVVQPDGSAVHLSSADALPKGGNEDVADDERPPKPPGM